MPKTLAAAGEAQRVARLRAMPREITPATISATHDLYAGLHPPLSFDGIAVENDVAYGPDPRQRLDLFRPEQAGSGRPVLIFVHGGGFTGGDKSDGKLFHSHIGVWAARQGWVGVVMTYRLAPQHVWPAGRDDVAAVVEFVRREITTRGGDAGKVILMGHSAGGTHVGSYLATAPAVPVYTAVLVSGLYQFDPDAVSPGARAYVGDDPEACAARMPLAGIARSQVPLIAAVAELEPPLFHDQVIRLIAACQETGRPTPRCLYVADHNHFSPILHVGLGATPLTQALQGCFA